MEYVIVGQIVNTHGIKGELKVKSSTDFIEERFKKGSHIYIGVDNQKKDMKVLSYRIHKGHVLLTFQGYQDINMVEQYKGCYLYADKNLDLLDDGEYYIGDLIGCEVYNYGEFIGIVKEVRLYDHHDVLSVEGKEKILIPYVEALLRMKILIKKE